MMPSGGPSSPSLSYPREPAEIELHLPLVLGLERALLELDRDQAPELAVVEEQIDVEVVAVELDALLPGDEGEAGAEFEQEELQLAQDRVFKSPAPGSGP